MDKTEKAVIEIITDQMGVDADTITPETTLAELNADDLDCDIMAVCLEDEFEVNIPNGDIEGFQTVGDVIKFIKNNI